MRWMEADAEAGTEGSMRDFKKESGSSLSPQHAGARCGRVMSSRSAWATQCDPIPEKRKRCPQVEGRKGLGSVLCCRSNRPVASRSWALVVGVRSERTPSMVGWGLLPMAYTRATVERPNGSPELGNSAKAIHVSFLGYICWCELRTALGQEPQSMV